MRYGRRRRSFPWARVLTVGLAVIGAASLLLAVVNWRSLRGLYQTNLVSGAVRDLAATVDFEAGALRSRRLAAGEAADRLQRGLADLGLRGRVSSRR